MSKGIADLHPVKKWSIGIGAGVGIVLALLPVVLPKKAKWAPSAAGTGLVSPPYSTIMASRLR